MKFDISVHETQSMHFLNCEYYLRYVESNLVFGELASRPFLCNMPKMTTRIHRCHEVETLFCLEEVAQLADESVIESVKDLTLIKDER